LVTLSLQKVTPSFCPSKHRGPESNLSLNGALLFQFLLVSTLLSGSLLGCSCHSLSPGLASGVSSDFVWSSVKEFQHHLQRVSQAIRFLHIRVIETMVSRIRWDVMDDFYWNDDTSN